MGWIISSLGGLILLGIGQDLSMWLPAAILASVLSPLINTSNQAIWQAKVAPDVQGRVFSARRLIAWITNPISPIIAGLLADYVMEPAMAVESPLASIFGGLVGTGPGSGMGLLLVFSGIAAGLVGLSAYFIPVIRNAEDLLPDHDQLEKVQSSEADSDQVPSLLDAEGVGTSIPAED